MAFPGEYLQTFALLEHQGTRGKSLGYGRGQKGDPIIKPRPQKGDPLGGVSLVYYTVLLCEGQPVVRGTQNNHLLPTHRAW